MTKVGIFSGTFDPVHGGHITLALEALDKASLDMVYFLPERSPRRKSGITHYAHRVAMLRLALKPYKKLEVLELPDKQFSVSRTLPRLQSLLGEAEIHQIIGSDMLEMLVSSRAKQEWPGFETYLQKVRLIVGLRASMESVVAEGYLKQIQLGGLIIFGDQSEVSSSDIRRAVGMGRLPTALLKSLRPYIAKNWLYHDLEKNRR